MEGVSGGGSPPADFSIPAGRFSGGFFWRIFPLHFATTAKSTAKSTAPWRVLVSESPRPEAPEIHRPHPPGESKSKSCAFGSGTVAFQGGSFQEKDSRFNWTSEPQKVWDSVKQSEGWGRNTALIARSPTRHSNNFIEDFHHKSSLLVWLPKIKKWITTNGFANSIPQTDSEAAILQLGEHVARELGLRFRASPPHSHQSNGAVERLHRTLFDQLGAVRLQWARNVGLAWGLLQKLAVKKKFHTLGLSKTMQSR